MIHSVGSVEPNQRSQGVVSLVASSSLDRYENPFSAVEPIPKESLNLNESVGFDLHDGPGQLVVAIHLLAHRYADEVPEDSVWKTRILRLAHLAQQAKWEMDRIAQGLTLDVEADIDIRNAVGKLARQFEADSGITVLDRVHKGRGSVAGPELTAALRIAHQALMNAWRHSRCQTVRLELRLRTSDALLTVSDDGIGLGQRWQDREGRLGYASMRRTASRAGGTLKMLGNRPHGVTVQALIPREA